MADKLEVLPGQGMVARFGEVAIWAGPQCSPALLSHLVTEAQRAAQVPSGGEQLANSLISVLQRGDPEPQAPFAVVGPAPGGLGLLLHGPVQAWDSGRWLAPQPVPGWMTASIARPWPLIVLPYGANPPPQSQQGNPFDLLVGVVPGSGFVMLRPPSAPGPNAGGVASGVGVPGHGAMSPTGSAGPAGASAPGAGAPHGGPIGGGPIGGGPIGGGPVGGQGQAGGLFGGGPSPEPHHLAGPGSPASGTPVASEGGPVAGGPVAGGPVAGGPVAGGPVAGGPVAGGSGGPGTATGFGGTPSSAQGTPTAGPTQAQSGPSQPSFSPLAPPVAVAGATAAAGAPSTMDLRNVLVAGSSPLPLASNAGAPLDRPEVPGVYCERGHLNHPGSSRCARCGRAIAPGAQAASGPRPPVGVLLADDGSIWALDKSYLIGADPASAGEVRMGTARAISMRAGANHTMAPIQSEVKVSGWNVYLVDRGADGGAYWQGPSGTGWVQLGRNEQRELTDGAHISCGGRVLTYLSAWSSLGQRS